MFGPTIEEVMNNFFFACPIYGDTQAKVPNLQFTFLQIHLNWSSKFSF